MLFISRVLPFIHGHSINPIIHLFVQVGYVIVPVRSAGNRPAPEWQPLLSSKYSKTKPEVRLSVYVDDGSSATCNSASQISAAERTTGETSSGVTDVTYKGCCCCGLVVHVDLWWLLLMLWLLLLWMLNKGEGKWTD